MLHSTCCNSRKFINRKASFCEFAAIGQSVQRLATGWTVRRSSSGGGEIFRTRPDRPWGPPSLLYNGYRAFPRGKAAGASCWPPPPSSAEVEGRVQLYICSPSGPSWPVLGRTLPLPLPLCFEGVNYVQLSKNGSQNWDICVLEIQISLLGICLVCQSVLQ